MRPGQTAWRSSRKSVETARELGERFLLLWTFIGLLTGGALINALSAADLITSSITADGMIMTSSSFIGDETTLSSRIMGTDLATVNQEIDTFKSLAAQNYATSDGTLLIREWAGTSRKRDQPGFTCAFTNQTDPQNDQKTSHSVSGILHHGRYASAQDLTGGLSVLTQANGTGMMHREYWRETMNGTGTGRSVAAGNLTMNELMRTDQSAES